MCNAQLFLIRPVYTTVQHVATEQTLLHRDVSETWPSTSSRNAGCSSDPVCLSCKGFPMALYRLFTIWFCASGPRQDENHGRTWVRRRVCQRTRFRSLTVLQRVSDAAGTVITELIHCGSCRPVVWKGFVFWSSEGQYCTVCCEIAAGVGNSTVCRNLNTAFTLQSTGSC